MRDVGKVSSGLLSSVTCFQPSWGPIPTFTFHLVLFSLSLFYLIFHFPIDLLHGVNEKPTYTQKISSSNSILSASGFLDKLRKISSALLSVDKFPDLPLVI